MKDQDAIKAELDKLTIGGVLKPEDVVAFARDKQTALHSCFTWDDTEAAHQYRLVQARQIIRVFVVVEPGAPRNVRAFVSLTPDRKKEGGGYRPLVSVMSDGELYQQLLQDALRELSAMQQRYRRIKELEKVFLAAEEAAKQQSFKLSA